MSPRLAGPRSRSPCGVGAAGRCWSARPRWCSPWPRWSAWSPSGAGAGPARSPPWTRRRRPTTTPPTTVESTAHWKTFTDAAHNLRLRYPPDWVVRRRHDEGTVTLAPREHAAKALAQSPPAAVTVTAGGSYYLGEAPEPGFTWGRLPGGQAYLRFRSDPAQMVEWPSGPKLPADVADRSRTGSYSIDWGATARASSPTGAAPTASLSPSPPAAPPSGTATCRWPRRSSD